MRILAPIPSANSLSLASGPHKLSLVSPYWHPSQHPPFFCHYNKSDAMQETLLPVGLSTPVQLSKSIFRAVYRSVAITHCFCFFTYTYPYAPLLSDIGVRGWHPAINSYRESPQQGPVSQWLLLYRDSFLFIPRACNY